MKLALKHNKGPSERMEDQLKDFKRRVQLDDIIEEALQRHGLPLPQDIDVVTSRFLIVIGTYVLQNNGASFPPPEHVAFLIPGLRGDVELWSTVFDLIGNATSIADQIEEISEYKVERTKVCRTRTRLLESSYKLDHVTRCIEKEAEINATLGSIAMELGAALEHTRHVLRVAEDRLNNLQGDRDTYVRFLELQDRESELMAAIATIK